MGKHYGWDEQFEEQQSAFAAEGPGTPAYASYGEFSKPAVPSSPSASSHGSGHATLAVASSLLAKVPGAKTVSLFNATVLGLLGLGAVLAAWAGGSAMLLAVLARWYLPAQDLQYALPLYFDYAAGPSAAGAWLPLLQQNPLTATLTPPAHQRPPPAAGYNFQGSISPGGGGSFSFTSGDGSNPAGSAGFFGNQLGFLGLGFGPGSRAAAAATQSGRGWFGRSRGSKQQKQSSSGGFLRGVDVGSGVFVPEADWLVPSWGRMKLSIELEMPPWPDSDLVQVTSELVSQQGIVLGRSTRTWVPKPKPLLHRLADAFLRGPWRALGLLDNTLRVSLPMFDGFQNPQPPPGGWSSVHGLRPAKARVTECTAQGSAGDAGAAGAGSSSGYVGGEEGSAEVSGPRAMWLRVTMIGRAVGFGPPKVYRATAKLELKLGLLDRLAVALRPSLTTLLLLLLLGVGLLAGGTGTAAVLLLLAYSLYRWASDIGHPEQQYGGSTAAATAAAAPAGALHGVELQEETSQASVEGYYEPAYETDREIEGFSDGLEGVGAAAAESSVGRASEVPRAFSPALMDDGSQDEEQEYVTPQPQNESADYADLQQQQQQQRSSAAAQHGTDSGGGAFNAIMHMFGYGRGERTSEASSASTAAAAADREGDGGGVSNDWQEQLLAESDDDGGQQQQQQQRRRQQQLYNDDVIDMPSLHKGGVTGWAAGVDDAHSTQTAAGTSRRIGYSYHM